MNVLSLFDGMSCGRIALERAGIKIDNYYASEIDKYAIQVAQKNYPDTIQVGNILELKGSDLPQIDLLIGGSPCQGFSMEGKKLAFDDPRSKLFFEFIRLLEETTPKYFLLENVRMKEEHQDIISEYLGVQPMKINSNLLTAQNRTRLYWTNIPNVEQPEDKGLLYKDIKYEGTNEVFWKDFQMEKYKNNEYVRKDFYKVISDEEKVPCLMAQYGSNRPKTSHESGNFRVLNPIEWERLQTVPDNYTEGLSNYQRYQVLGNGWTIDVVSHIFNNMDFSNDEDPDFLDYTMNDVKSVIKTK